MREGATEFVGPPTSGGRGPRSRTPVFYNPAMAMDRDLGVACLRARGLGRPPAWAGWEVTSATGIRGLRLLGESGAFQSFLFTESGVAAFAVLSRNVAGRLGARALRVDGRVPPEGTPFDFVDLDPYGSPIPFARAALGAVRAGGLLAVTATDMMVLAGAQPSAALRRYGARPVRGRLGPEGGLRVLLAYLAREAQALGRSIRPVLGYVREHYVRAYVEVSHAPGTADPVGSIDPSTWDGPPVGDRGPYGPLWLGPVLEPELLSRMQVPSTAAAGKELGRFLERLREEATVPRAFYYEPNTLAGRLGLAQPPSLDGLLEGLRSRGYRAARTHVRPEGIRTDAPRTTVEEVARAPPPRSQSQNARVRA